MAPRNVNRWRQRLNTISATSSADPDDGDGPARTDPVDGVHHVGEPVGAQPRRLAEDRRVDPVGDAARPLRSRCAMTVQSASRSATATSQPLPVKPMLRGSGGAAPDGRRRRRSGRAVDGPGTARRDAGDGRRPAPRSAASVVTQSLRGRASRERPPGRLAVAPSRRSGRAARRWSSRADTASTGRTTGLPERVDDLACARAG